ncbi:MAG: class I SAM-dependent methyltransferase [Sandaracinaceae bacterium]|nr:class I SAM-dependent methyltransferase [Sandaracinaceae bacterium]
MLFFADQSVDVVIKLVRERFFKDAPRAYADTHSVALSLFESAPPCRVLDIAAGRGDLTRKLINRGHQVTALESYTPQFNAPFATLVEGDANREWPFPDASFDALFGIEIIEHVENPRFFLREAMRVLRPGGIAIISTPNLTTLVSRVFFGVTGQWDLFVNNRFRLRDPYDDALDGHISPIPNWLLRHHARDAGLEHEETAYSRAWLPLLPWKLNPLPASASFGRILVARFRKPVA